MTYAEIQWEEQKKAFVKIALQQVLRAYRVVYWRNVFRATFLRLRSMDDGPVHYYDELAELSRCNSFILDRIRELQQEIYPTV